MVLVTIIAQCLLRTDLDRTRIKTIHLSSPAELGELTAYFKSTFYFINKQAKNRKPLSRAESMENSRYLISYGSHRHLSYYPLDLARNNR